MKEALTITGALLMVAGGLDGFILYQVLIGFIIFCGGIILLLKQSERK
jgi:hypothetical protein